MASRQDNFPNPDEAATVAEAMGTNTGDCLPWRLMALTAMAVFSPCSRLLRLGREDTQHRNFHCLAVSPLWRFGALLLNVVYRGKHSDPNRQRHNRSSLVQLLGRPFFPEYPSRAPGCLKPKTRLKTDEN